MQTTITAIIAIISYPKTSNGLAHKTTTNTKLHHGKSSKNVLKITFIISEKNSILPSIYNENNDLNSTTKRKLAGTHRTTEYIELLLGDSGLKNNLRIRLNINRKLNFEGTSLTHHKSFCDSHNGPNLFNPKKSQTKK